MAALYYSKVCKLRRRTPSDLKKNPHMVVCRMECPYFQVGPDGKYICEKGF